jgi:phage/plasmid-associated DNA primase
MESWIRAFYIRNQSFESATHCFESNLIEFPQDYIEDFWVQYCDAVRRNESPKIYEYVQYKDSIPLGYDFLFQFNRDGIPVTRDDALYLINGIDRFIMTVVGTIQRSLKSCFELQGSENELFACVLNRDHENLLTWSNEDVRYVARVIFPYAKIQKEHVGKFYHIVIDDLTTNTIRPEDLLGYQCRNGINSIIVPISGEKIELYGSDEHNLTLSKIYSDITFAQNYYDLETVFDPKLHSAVKTGLISHEVISQNIYQYGTKFWLPLLFSVQYNDDRTMIPKDFLKQNIQASNLDMSSLTDELANSIQRCRKLLSFISFRRAKEYWSWVDIGLALMSVKEDEGFELWCSFSVNSTFRDKEECEEYRSSITGSGDINTGVTIETLEYFAYLDNKVQYENYRRKDITDAINNAIFNQEHSYIANAFYLCFPFDFLCSNYEHNEWYYYTSHRWIKIDGTSTLVSYINTKFRNIIEQRRVELAKLALDSRDTEFKNRQNTIITLISKLICKLSNISFKEAICKEAKIYYHKPDFNKFRHLNYEFTGVSNGVIDVRGGVTVFRQGKPQDYITKCTRSQYREFTWSDKEVVNTMSYLNKVFRNQNVRKYITLFLASLLYTGNRHKLFMIFTGETNNSKSILIRLLEYTLGDYVIKLPISLITSKRTAADSATPTMMIGVGAKLGVFQEGDKTDVIRAATVKEISGNDEVYGRDLYQKAGTITSLAISYIPVLVTNNIPEIRDCQSAFWQRTKLIDFTSTWVQNPPASEEEQFKLGLFPMDPNFDSKVKSFANPLLWIMTQMYSTYVNEGLQAPNEVNIATDKFREKSSIYINFTRDCIKQALTKDGLVDMEISITLDEAFNAFKVWFRDQEFKRKIPNKAEFKEEIERIWHQKLDNERKWYGVQLNNIQTNLSAILMGI